MDFDELRERLLAFPVKQFGHGATTDEIEQAEAKLGVVLPESFRAFLQQLGWGGVEDIELYGLGSDVPEFLDLVRVTEAERTVMQPPLPPHLVPVLNDGGGNHYCLDSSRQFRGESPIVFWEHESGPLQQPEDVANSFPDWLAEELDARSAE